MNNPPQEWGDRRNRETLSSKMATCTEENVSTVQTKRLKENIDIKEVKCVKCSPGNSFLLVQRLDFALNLVYVKTGRVNLVCKDVKE